MQILVLDILYIAGTDHPVPHLYDVNTFQCYLSSSIQEGQINDAINQVSLFLFCLLLQVSVIMLRYGEWIRLDFERCIILGLYQKLEL